MISKEDQIKAIEEVREFLQQPYLMVDFQEFKKKDISYKLLYAIESIKEKT